MKIEMTNFHMHTSRCHHASGTDEQFVLEAIRNGYKKIGFSDHACWNFGTGYKSHMRMTVEEFADYKKSVINFKNRYKDKVDISLGMEAEYFPDLQDWLLRFCAEEDIEYLVFGNHFYKNEELHVYYGNTREQYTDSYFDMCVDGLKTGMYSYLAHPELILRNEYLVWNDHIESQFARVCQVCKDLDIPLEYNVLGMQMNERTGFISYPHPKFWQLAGKMGCKAIIGMDAHCVNDLNKNLYFRAYEDLKSYGVTIVRDIKKIDYKKLLNDKKNNDLFIDK